MAERCKQHDCDDSFLLVLLLYGMTVCRDYHEDPILQSLLAASRIREVLEMKGIARRSESLSALPLYP